MMNWYTTRDGDYVSVIVPGMNRYDADSRKGTLSDDEIRVLWTVCDVRRIAQTAVADGAPQRQGRHNALG